MARRKSGISSPGRLLPDEDTLVRMLSRGLPQTSRTLMGPGDDCAVISGPGKGTLTLFKTDCVIAGVHFLMETDAARVGWKALCRVISDIAASGGEPREALVTLAMPRDTPLAWVQRLYTGLRKAARRFSCGIAGGETSSLPQGAPAMISVAMLGTVERTKLVLRSGGRPGDRLFVTGRLGGSFAGKHLDFTPRLAEARWLVSQGRGLTAMMDLSDGLAKDLPRLAAANGCGYLLDRQAVPRNPRCSVEQALGDGEDYELLFAWRGRDEDRLLSEWRAAFPQVRLTAVGHLTAPGEGERGDGLRGGWDHFAASQRGRNFQ